MLKIQVTWRLTEFFFLQIRNHDFWNCFHFVVKTDDIYCKWNIFAKQNKIHKYHLICNFSWFHSRTRLRWSTGKFPSIRPAAGGATAIGFSGFFHTTISAQACSFVNHLSRRKNASIQKWFNNGSQHITLLHSPTCDNSSVGFFFTSLRNIQRVLRFFTPYFSKEV